MSLDELPEVKIEHSGTFKFIVLMSEDGRYYLRGASVSQHAQIANDLFAEELKEKGLAEERFLSAGGGTLQFDNLRLTAFGSSGTYGRFNKEAALELLKRYASQNLPEFSVEIR